MIYHVYANRSNAGDWLSAKGIQSLLGAGPYREVLCDEPFVPESIASLSEARPDDFVLIGGGGLFMDYFTPFWTQFEPLSRRLRFAIWGVGYCDLKSEPSRAPEELLSTIIQRSRLCCVRDDLSRRHLNMTELPEPVPCPSMNVIKEVPAGSGLLHVDNFSTAGEATYEAMDRAGQEFAVRTGRTYRQTNNRIPAGNVSALERCLRLYANADIVFSSALHGCIIGLAMGKKVLAVSGDRKIDAFMESMGLSAWVLHADPEQPFETYLSRLVSGQPPVVSRVEAVRTANRNIAEQIRIEIDRA